MSIRKEKFEKERKWADKAHCERDMKTCISLKGEQTEKMFKGYSRGFLQPFSYFILSLTLKFKGKHLGLSIGDVAEKLRDEE